jgi:hypothetical protein
MHNYVLSKFLFHFFLNKNPDFFFFWVIVQLKIVILPDIHASLGYQVSILYDQMYTELLS